MNIKPGKEAGQHWVEFETKKQAAWTVLRTFGLRPSTLLGALDIMTGLGDGVSYNVRMSEADLRVMNERLQPTSLELHGYVANLGSAALRPELAQPVVADVIAKTA